VIGNKVYKIALGFLLSGGAKKPQECLLPFKVFSVPHDGKKTRQDVKFISGHPLR
jgi:hypothetical protein